MFFKKSLSFVFLLFGVLAFTSIKANAEEIPVLIWERGQVQNIVLGQGESDVKWNIYLKNSKGQKFQTNASLANRDNFLVYSINLPKNLSLEGYVIEAASPTGEIRQVAGVQIVEATAKEITRVPIELILILLGVSYFLYFLNLSRGKILQLRNLEELGDLARMESQGISFFRAIPNRFRMNLRKDSKASLLKVMLDEELKFDLKLSNYVFIAGIVGIGIISYLQFTNGIWSSGNYWLVAICLILGNFSMTYGSTFALLSLLYLLLNIAMAKSLGEILAIFVMSSLFLLPNIYNQFLQKVFSHDLKHPSKYLMSNVVSAVFSGLAIYQLMLLHESLNSIGKFPGNSEEIVALTLTVFFLIKNFYIEKSGFDAEVFEVIRPIGPMSSSLIAIFSGAVIYLWTANLLIASVSVLSIMIILSLTWLKINIPIRFNHKNLNLGFMLGLVFTIFLSVFLSSRVLPLDIVNQSHLLILLVFPIDLLIAFYLTLSKTHNHVEVVN